MDDPVEVRPPILVVDDNIEEAEQLCQLFDALGASATLAFGAISAAKLQQSLRPAIVVLVELRLGGDDCRSVMAWLRGQADEATRPYYVCVGHRVEGRERSGEPDFDLYLDLPVSPAIAQDLVHIASLKHRHVEQPGRPDAPLRAPRQSANASGVAHDAARPT